MSRPTAGALTGAGYTLSSGSKYAKTTGTVTNTIDIDGPGVAGIAATTPGIAMTQGDLTSHMATLVALGVTTGVGVPATTAGGLQYFGVSI
jgi:hypothetical protein